MSDCPHCGGRLFPDRDGDPQCVLCGRYAAIILAEPLPDVEPEPVYPPESDVARSTNPDTVRVEKRRTERKALGLCVRCGGNAAAVKSGLCQPHLEKERERSRRSADRRRVKAVAQGLCPTCCKRPIQVGYVVCDGCRANNQRYKRNRVLSQTQCRCGVWFTPTNNRQRFHSPKCRPRKVQKRRVVVAVCEHCGKELPGVTVRKRFCNDKCSSKARYRPA